MKKIILLFFLVLLSAFETLAQDELALKILEKPTPRFSSEQEKDPPHMQGTITLRVEFLGNGKIGNVTPVSDLLMGLTENAVEAAKKIKFAPTIKGGIPITVTKQVQYSYQYGWIPISLIDEKAEAIIKRAVEKLGGEKYLQVKTVYSTGYYTIFRVKVQPQL